jgi:hypothetical protein
MKSNRATKFILLAVAVCVLALVSSVQAKEIKITKKDLPAAVLTAFQTSYPNAVIKGLSKEEENKITCFEIESVDGKTNRDILYTADGKATEIEETINKNDLPKDIQSLLKSSYAKSKIVKMERVIKDSTTGYEIQVRTGKKMKELSFDASGKLLNGKSKKSEKEEEEEKDEEEED